MDANDKKLFDIITDILWMYGCTFDMDGVDFENNTIDDVDCPDEVTETVAVKIAEAIDAVSAGQEYVTEREEYNDYVWRVPRKYDD